MPPKSKATKRSKEDSSSSDDNSEKGKPKPTKKAKVSSISPINIEDIDFTCEATSSTGKSWNLKISSWNVNGIRAWLDKGGLKYLELENPDILCLQETKCSPDKIPASIQNAKGYHCFWLEGEKSGYCGLGLMTKKEPLKVSYGIGIEKHDKEGRVITAEYDNYYLVTTYVPNAGRGLVRLNYRKEWNSDFDKYIKDLDDKKQVILCGDMNVAHQEIDIANPKSNKKNAGFTPEEREGFTHLLSLGFLDTFRHLYPDTVGSYTFWTYLSNARSKNVGWRLDYFILSEKLKTNLCDVKIRSDVYGSDHCPLTLFLHI